MSWGNFSNLFSLCSRFAAHHGEGLWAADGSKPAALAGGTGTAQLTNVDDARTKASDLRVSSTGTAGNRWSIADVRL
ncbi:hypothetical protein [Arthrobacter sp. Soil762]|uniref:hypothetical protein n=1 Tax=Arthrobacter sp. Soil762 TaxID=1736401 RepID=UPI000A6C2BAD|nr:hypothetical protein [Arthrobacter sp. Soil762]